MDLIKPEFQAPRLITIPGHVSDSGSVHFLENSGLFPHGVLRCFWLSGIKAGETRGNHAHWKESQALIALTGKVEVKVEGIDGSHALFQLEAPNVGLWVPPLNWIEIQFSEDAVLLGLGDQVFSEEDYIRDYHDFGNLQERNR